MYSLVVLIAATIKNLFLGGIHFSPIQNVKKKEMATYMMFGDYLEECEGILKQQVLVYGQQLVLSIDSH